jgi:predicted molibdopterin-dependent oxidoreductase YjgC
MRIENHPVLDFGERKTVAFTFDGKGLTGYENEPIAAALHAAGMRDISSSFVKHRPRGLYCAIGNCSSCMMVVNGESNVRICLEPLKEGMIVEIQKGKGDIL